MSPLDTDGWEPDSEAARRTVAPPPRIRAPLGNPYRRPAPPPQEIIAAGKFYLANDKGTYGLKTTPVYLKLCREYLWVTDLLSIPLASIVETGLSKKGAYITYQDSIAGAVVKFNFTKIGVFTFRPKESAEFIKILEQYVPTRDSTTLTTNIEFPELATARDCEICGSSETFAYEFREFMFIGIAPLMFYYRLTPTRYVLCETHAGNQAMKSSVRTALWGYLGIPGFIAAPWYVCSNLLSLRKGGRASSSFTLKCLTLCVAIPLCILATPVVIFLVMK